MRQEVRVPVYPPALLIRPTAEPVLRADSWGDIAILASENRRALRDCNADKASIRALEKEFGKGKD